MNSENLMLSKAVDDDPTGPVEIKTVGDESE